jgi:hypothetical protein
MLYHTSSLVIALVLGGSMVLVFWAGVRLKRRRIRKERTNADEGLGAIEGSLLGLLALLLSFTFGMSNSRYENRYQVMVHEANCLGTVILRADLFPDSASSVFKKNLSGYLTSRIDLYQAGIDPEKNEAAIQQSSLYGEALWREATAITQNEDAVKRNSGSLMVTALNDLFDAATSRKASRDDTIPESVLWLLFLLCYASAFIVGYGSRARVNWVMVASFAIMVAITVFAILDLDRPHRGLITLDKAEALIVQLRDSLK